MFRSVSYHASDRNDPNFPASPTGIVISTQRRKSIPKNLFGNQQSIKKAFSLIIHHIDSAMCDRKDANEMHEFIRYTTSEENLNTIHRSVPDFSHSTMINQQSICSHANSGGAVHQRFSRWKNKFKCRQEPSDPHHEKNEGFLVVVNPELEPILMTNDSFDQQQTQHAQPCVHINNASFDLNQIQYSSVTSIVTLSSPPPTTAFDVYMPAYDIIVNHALDFQSTRSSIECGVPQGEDVHVQETPMSQMISVASPSSTNSSSDEYTDIDRSLLNDVQYVRAQELDFHRLIDMEIDLCKDRSFLEQCLEDEEDLSRAYDAAFEENLKLKAALKALQEPSDPRCVSWSCELCTFINKPFIETKCDTCDMCDGPSPLKRATLIQ